MDSYYNEMIDHAVIHFRKLLEGQLDRQNRMEQAAPAKDFANLDTIMIGVCGGDGIGPIITNAAEKILRTLLKEEIGAGRVLIKNIEGLTLENRLAHNQAVPDDVMEEIKACEEKNIHLL